MLRRILCGFLASFVLSSAAYADATVPTKDITGSADSEVIGRLSGSFIIDYVNRDFDEATFPLSKLLHVKGEKVGNNNQRFRPDDEKTVEGARTRIVYLNREDSSSLKVIRAYQRELEGQGGVELYGCNGGDCGGSDREASGGGGGKMSLGQYLWPPENISGQGFSNSRCAQLNRIADQRYTLIHVPKLKTYVSIHAFQFNGGTFCEEIKGRTVSIIDIVKVGGLEAEFVTVKADEMAAQISGTGKIALYGILFDTAKADIKPESTATLSEIASLLNGESALRLLIVGHTDTQGSYDHNLNLSQRRAESVVQSLANDHGVARGRLFPVGVSFASPVASNGTEEGRAKNRRVELVSF